MNQEIREGSSEAPEAPIPPLWQRAIGLVTTPRTVFEHLARRPTWLPTTLVLAAFSLIVMFVIFDPVIYPAQMEQLDRQDMTAEQRAQAEEAMASPAMKGFIGATGVIVNFAFVAISGLLMYAICVFGMGGRGSFKHGASVAAHAMLVMIPRAFLVLPLMLARKDPTLSLGPGVLFPPSEAVDFGGRFIASLLAGLDLFNLWGLALAVLGMSVISRQPTAKVGTAFAVAYGLIIVVWSLIAAAFGR